MKLEDAEFCTDGLLLRSSKESHTRLITIVRRARENDGTSRICPIFGVIGLRCIDDNFVKRTYDRRELRAQKGRYNSDLCDSQVSITADYQ